MTALDYLEAANVEELARQLQADGYVVFQANRSGDDDYDIIAAKNGKRMAYKVKASASLKESARAVSELQKKARATGFDDFRLVIVNPPRETKVEISGLREELSRHLDQVTPPELLALPETPRIAAIRNVRVDAINIREDGIRVAGGGTLLVQFGGPNKNAHYPYEWETNVPFTFDARLTHDLKIDQLNEWRVDTSSLAEEFA